MRKLLKKTGFYLVTFISILLIFSCNIGLGSQVDTQDPVLNVTYPKNGATVMGTFSLAGTVSDDLQISYVKVVLTHKTLKTEYAYSSQEGQVKIENAGRNWKKGTTWVSEINKKTDGEVLFNGWDLPDGEYFIDVEANDGANSVYERRTIIIDNTPPVFIAENLTSFNSSSYRSTFGQKINLTGKALDDSGLEKVIFSVYDESKTLLGSNTVDYDMTSDGIILAQYVNNPVEESQKILAKNFNLIYGLEDGAAIPKDPVTNKEITKERYFVVQFSDKARCYNNPIYEDEDSYEGDGFNGTGSGNISTKLYLNTQDFGLKSITIDDLNTYEKHLTENLIIESKLLSVSGNSIAQTQISAGSDFSKVNYMKIDPEISPKWSVDGFDISATDEYKNSYIESTLTFNFEAGNDNQEFKPCDIKIYLVNTSTAERILLKEGISSSAKTLSYTESVKLTTKVSEDDIEGVQLGGKYRFDVTGADMGSVPFQPKETKGYGFIAIKSATSPKINLVEPTVNESWYGSNSENIPFNFEIESDEDMDNGYPKVTVKTINSKGVEQTGYNGEFCIKDNAGETSAGSKFTFEIPAAPAVRNEDTHKYTFNWKLKNAAGGNLPAPNNDGLYKYIVEVQALDKAQGYSSKTFRFNMDNQKPVIVVESVTPEISESDVDGVLNHKAILLGNADDKNPSTAVPALKIYEVDAGGNKTGDALTTDGLVSANPGITNKFALWSYVVDTTKLTDETDYIFEVSVKDNYGNEGTVSKKFKISQVSDRPVFETFGNLENDSGYTKNSFGLTSGNKISGAVTDDDGVQSIDVRVRGVKGDGSDAVWTDNDSDWTNVTNDGTSTIDYVLSNRITQDGKYQIQFRATDKGGNTVKINNSDKYAVNTNVSGIYNILVDGTSPSFIENSEVVKYETTAGEKTVTADGYFYIPKLEAGKKVKVSVDILEGNLKKVYVNGSETGVGKERKDNSTTEWTATYKFVPSSEGVNTITFKAEDESGNTYEKSVSLYYDETVKEINAPTVIPEVLTGDTINGEVTFKGSVSDNDKVAKIELIASPIGKAVVIREPIENSTNYEWKINTADTSKYADGALKLTVKVTDRAGNQVSKDFNYVIDQNTDKPVISFGGKIDNTLTTQAQVVANAAMKNMLGLDSNNTISGSVSDDDGVPAKITIQAYKANADGSDKTGDALKTVTFTNKSSFSVNIKDDLNIKEDGAFFVVVKTEDNINRSEWTDGKDNGKAEEMFCIIVDGAKPVINNIKVGSKTYYSDGNANSADNVRLTEVYVNAKETITFEVKENHLDYVKIGNKYWGRNPEGGAYETMPAADANNITTFSYANPDLTENGTKTYEIVAVDGSGLSAQTEINIVYDTKPPVINDLDITPDVLSGNTVNGKITIEGSVDDDNFEKIEYAKIGTTEAKYTGQNFKFTDFDTTTVAGTLTVEVKVLDKAGNESTGTFDYPVDQSTDTPVITPTGFALDKTETEITSGDNRFSTKGLLEATITDDDGIGSVIVEYKKNGEGDWVTASGVSFSGTSLKWTLPDVEAKYQIQITAKDSKQETDYCNKVVTTWIGVSSGAPTISVNKTKTEYKKDSESVSIPVKYTGGATAKVTRKVEVDDGTKSSTSTDITKNLVKGSYQEDSVTASTGDDKNAKVTVTYTVANDFGQSASTSYVYYLDNVIPAYNSLKVDSYDYAEDKWRGEANIPLVGTWKDAAYNSINGSGVKEFDYYIVQFSDSKTDDEMKAFDPSAEANAGLIKASGTFTPSSETNGTYTFDQNMYGFVDGKNYLYIRARDAAGNNSDFSHFNLNVDTTAPELTLDTEGMKLENNVLYVKDLSNSDNNIVVKCTLEDKVSFINGWHSVAVFEKTSDTFTVPKDKFNDWESNETTWSSGMVGFAYLGEDDPTQEDEENKYSKVTEKSFTITLDKSKLSKESGNYKNEYKIIVVGIDYKNNYTTQTFTVVEDKVAPTIDTPNVTSYVEANGKSNNVNGNVTIAGAVSDNVKVDEITVTLKQGETEIDLTDVLTISGSNYKITDFDTTTLKTGDDPYEGEIVLKVTAKDRAGNTAEKTEKLYVDQSTDLPTCTTSNASGSQEKDNLFGMGAWVINGTAGDDDGVSKVEAQLGNGSYETLFTATKGQEKTSQNFTYSIPDNTAEGEYSVTFKVTDVNDKETTLVIPFAVDTAVPSVRVVKINGKDPSTENYVGTDFDVLLEVSDTNTKGLAETNPVICTPSKVLTIETVGGKTYYKDSHTGVNASGTCSYKVTDYYGRVNDSVSVAYIFDNTKPTTNTANITVQVGTDTATAKAYDSTEYFNSTDLTVTGASGAVTDDVALKSTASVKVGAGASTSFEMSVTGKTAQFSNKPGLSNGENTVTYTFSDKAGNTKEQAITIYVDTVAPTLEDGKIEDIDDSKKSVDITDKVAKVNSIKVTVKAKDGETGAKVSGLKTAYFGTKNGFKAEDGLLDSVSFTEKALSETKDITIDVSKWSEADHEIWVRLEDTAGNISDDVKVGTFTIDRTAPEVLYTSHANGSTVNKTITLGGKVSDSGANLDKDFGGKVYIGSDPYKTFTVSNENTNTWSWDVELDTEDTSFTQGESNTVKVVFCDKAGNESTETISLNVDQDSDRPVITLNTLNPTGTLAAETATVQTTGVIQGSVSDDDGIKEFYIQVTAKDAAAPDDTKWVSKYTENSEEKDVYDSTTKTFRYIVDDGDHKLWFKVIDNGGTSGTTFISGDSSSKPKIGSQKYAGSTDGAVVFTVDSTQPVIYDVQIKMDGEDNFTSLGQGAYLGGPKKGKATLQIIAKDNVKPNNKLEVTVEVNGGAEKGGSDIDFDYIESISFTQNTTTISGCGKYTKDVDFSDVGAFGNGTLTLNFTVSDKSDVPASLPYTVFVDNAAPNKDGKAITNFEPEATKEVTGYVTVSGTLNDDSGTAPSGVDGDSLYYYIPVSNGKTGGDKVEELVPTGAAPNWSSFDSKWTQTNLSVTDSRFELELKTLATSSAEITADYAGYADAEEEGLYNIPVWFKLSDKVGNTSYITNNVLKYNPDKAKPRLTIISPVHDDEVGEGVSLKAYKVMGGDIRITGSAEDDIGVKAVYLQYDIDGDGAYDKEDVKWLLEKGYEVRNIRTDALIAFTGTLGTSGITVTDSMFTDATTTVNNWGVKATGEMSWNHVFATGKLPDTPVLEIGDSTNTTNKTLNIRVCATDTEATIHVSNWSKELHISVNKSNPVFGEFKVVQYSDNTYATEIQRKNYTDSMYLTGNNWRLEGSVSDNGGITKVEKKVNGAEDAVVMTSELTASGTGKLIKVPVTPNNEKFVIELKAYDDENPDPHTTSGTYTVKIDNDAPAFKDGVSDDALVLYQTVYGRNNLANVPKIQNSNGWTTLASKVNETASGFDKAVFYVKRTLKNSNDKDEPRIYNIMEDCTATNIANRTDLYTGTGADVTENTKASDGVFINGDGLPVLEKTVTRPDVYTIVLEETGIGDNKNIRKGGAIFFGGNYKIISSYVRNSANKITVKVTEEVPTATYTKVQFVYGMVVNNIGERQSGDEIVNDDGDGMVESYLKSGTDYTWDATFDSSTIPDGAAEIHVVVFDVAGNSRHGKVEGIRFANRAPRITSVTLGTDLNDDNSYTGNELTTFYAYKNTFNGTEYIDRTRGKEFWDLNPSDETEIKGRNWKIKKNLTVKPEFVGGAAPFYYVFEKSEKLTDKRVAKDGTKNGPAALGAPGASWDATGVKGKFALNGTITLDNTKVKVSDAQEDKCNMYTFTFWDSTEGCTPGDEESGSSWCVLNATLEQDLVDGDTAVPYVNPFFWKGKGSGNNSLAWNSAETKPEGHIELAGALGDNITGASDGNNGTLGDDPKVSGKIVFRGTAYDGTVIKAIKFVFADKTAEITYDGTWTDVVDTDYRIHVEELSLMGLPRGISQYGHFVKWEFTVDTSKVVTNSVTGINKLLNVTVKDRNTLGTYVGNVPDTNPSIPGTETKYATVAQAALHRFYATADASKADTTELYGAGTQIFDRQFDKGEAQASPNTGVYAYTLHGTTSQYQMDIVPYVQEVVTSLSVARENNPSMYNRSSLGHYPVQSVVSNSEQLNNTDSEDVVLRGFNLGGTLRVSGGSRTYYATDAQAEANKYYLTSSASRADIYNAATGFPAGITVTSLTLIKGAIAEGTGVRAAYTYTTPATGSIIGSTITSRSGAKQAGEICFNAETLETGRATITVNGIPVMNNLNNNDNYGSCADAGTDYENCYNRLPNGENNNILTDDIEFDVWEFNDRVAKAANNGKMYGLNMKIDQTNKRLVYAYITSNKNFYMGNDSKSSAQKASSDDYLNPNTVGLGVYGSNYYATKHGGNDSDYYKVYSTVSGYNDKTMQSIAGGTGAKLKDVVYASSFAVSSSNVYHAYYDQLENKIKFLVGSQLTTKDSYQVVAGGDTSRNVGKFIGLAVSTNGSSQDVVSMVWYNQIDNKLQYSYKTAPAAATDNQANPDGWSAPVDVFEGEKGGQYCAIVADASNGIHIAANVGGKVKYAYASSAAVTSSSGFQTCLVDINAGKHLTLDVAFNNGTDQKPIPVIGYYSNISRPKYAKMIETYAKPKTGTWTLQAGVDSNNKYTGKWDVTDVPVTKTVTFNEFDKVNVGVWKSSGAMANSYTSGTTVGPSSYGGTDSTANAYSITYGNGTSNGILCYLTDGGENMETAQLR